MLISYRDVTLIKSLMDGTATREDFFWLNNQIEALEEEHQEYLEQQKKLDDSVLKSVKDTSFYTYGCGKTASEILSDVARDLRTEVSLPLITYSLRRLVAAEQVKRIENKHFMADRTNFYGKRYRPDVVFALVKEEN